MVAASLFFALVAAWDYFGRGDRIYAGLLALYRLFFSRIVAMGVRGLRKNLAGTVLSQWRLGPLAFKRRVANIFRVTSGTLLSVGCPARLDCTMVQRRFQLRVSRTAHPCVMLRVLVVLNSEVTLFIRLIGLDYLLIVGPWHSSCLWAHFLSGGRLLERRSDPWIFVSLLHLYDGAFCVVFNGSDSVFKLFEIKPGVCIEVHSSDDRDQEGVVWIDAALNEETFQV